MPIIENYLKQKNTTKVSSSSSIFSKTNVLMILLVCILLLISFTPISHNITQAAKNIANSLHHWTAMSQHRTKETRSQLSEDTHKFTLSQVNQEMKELGFFKEPTINIKPIQLASSNIISSKKLALQQLKIKKKKNNSKTTKIKTEEIVSEPLESISLNLTEQQERITSPFITEKHSSQLIVTQNDSQLLDQTLERAIDYMRQGKDKAALKLLNSKIIIKKADYRIYNTLSELYLQAHNIDQALRTVIVGLRKFPNHPNLLLMKSRTQEQMGKEKEALFTLTQATPNLSDHLDYYALMAKLYLKSKRPSIAIALYKKLLNHQPTYSNWWLGLGLAYEANNNYYLAKESFKKVKEIGTKDLSVNAFINKKLN